MNTLEFTFCGQSLAALPSGALWHPGAGLLCVSDLHLGKSDRIARREGRLLPPYEIRATLDRLATDLAATGARAVICLGDSFDDVAAAEGLGPEDRAALARLQEGREWIWVEGNHDPGAIGTGGTHVAETTRAGLCWRHIAVPGATAEVSGHYHPKVALRAGGGRGSRGSGRGGARPAFVLDARRMILPAYGAYTGGLGVDAPVLSALFTAPAYAILTGPRPTLCPLSHIAACA